MNKFSSQLIKQSQEYFGKRFDRSVSTDEAERYLDSLAGLFHVAISLTGGHHPPRRGGGDPPSLLTLDKRHTQ